MATFNVRGKNIKITQPLREYVEKRVGKITKYFRSIEEINVLLSAEKERQIVEVTVTVHGGLILRGQESTSDMYTSIDLVVEKIEKQIHKQKTKLERRFRNGEMRAEAFIESKIQSEQEEEYPIVKIKHFVIKPMSVQEAIMQMNLLNHVFFIFRNSETNEICTVYKRTAGAYGLLEFEG